MLNGHIARSITRFLLCWFKTEKLHMKTLYVRDDHSNVIHGVVTNLCGGTGIVLFDQGGSARFALKDGCAVGLGESDWNKAVKFSTIIDIKRPQPHGENNERRVVVCLNNRSAEWAYVWAYESDYEKALDELIVTMEEILRKEEQEEEERKRRILERETARAAIEGLGLFRIAQAHKFAQEMAPRPTKLATGPTKLFELLDAIYRGKVQFEPVQPKGSNCTLFMWIERQVAAGGDWVRCDISYEEMQLVCEVYCEEIEPAALQPFLDRMSVEEPELAKA